jgi:hypothetical protein
MDWGVHPDFTSAGVFKLNPADLIAVCKSIDLNTGIIFIPEDILVLRHQNENKGTRLRSNSGVQTI